MSSEVDICNLALSHLGDDAEVAAINPTPDGTVQAGHCARFYPIARDLLLEMHAWTFAVKRGALAQVENPASTDWGYAYRLPATCIRPIAVIERDAAVQSFDNDDPGAHPYMMETTEDGDLILLTNIDATAVRYIDRVTDTTRFTPGFVTALGRLLASMLAGPILKGEAGAKEGQIQREAFEREFAQAARQNSRIGNRGVRREDEDAEASSAVAIANLALAHLGASADIVSLADNTTEAAYCRQFYPIARNQLLEMHPWSFAVKRAELEAAAENPYEDDWAYAYELPAGCLRPLGALSPGVPVKSFGAGSDANSHPYAVETNADGDQILFTNIETASLRYIDKVTDVAKFSPTFTTALARLLAAMLAGPVLRTLTDGQNVVNVRSLVMKAEAEQRNAFNVEFARAAANDANVGKGAGYENYRPPWLAGRGDDRTA